MRISFFPQSDLEKKSFLYYMETLIDITFKFDIVINFFTAFERSDGEMEYRLKRIAINYITGFFCIDVISTFPFDIFSSEGNENDPVLKANNFLKLARLQSLYSMMRIIRILKVLNL